MPDPNATMELTEQDVERVRMAVAEAGYPPGSIQLGDAGAIRWSHAAGIPHAVIGKARMVAGIPSPFCLSCTERWGFVGLDERRRSQCLGSDIDPIDCGADRFGVPDA